MWFLLYSAAAVGTTGKGVVDGLRLALTQQGSRWGDLLQTERAFFMTNGSLSPVMDKTAV